MAYTLNPNYNPNDPKSQRYIFTPDVASGGASTPSVALPTVKPAVMAPVTAAPAAPAQLNLDPNLVPKIYQTPYNTAPAVPKPATPVIPAAPVAPVAPAPVTSVNRVPFIPSMTEQQKSGIWNLMGSGRAFSETDAKNYAFATGQSNYQQFIGKNGSQILGTAAPVAPAAPAAPTGGAAPAPVGGTGTGTAPAADTTGKSLTEMTDQEIAAAAGKSGMSVTDFLALQTARGGITQAQYKQIQNNLGIPDLVDKTFAMPSKTTTQLYTDLYNLSGLNEVKTKMAAIDDEIAKKRADVVTATGTELNNPWISQATRAGRLANLQKIANGDIQNSLDRRQQLLDLYNNGVGEIETQIKNSQYDTGVESNLNVAHLNYLLGEAEKSQTQAKDEATTKALRYLPDFLNNKPAGDGFTLSEGQQRYDSKGNLIASSGSTKDKIVKINGTDYVQNADGTYSIPQTPNSPKDTEVAAQINDKIGLIDSILTSPALNATVGTNPLARSNVYRTLTGEAQNFTAGVKQLISKETMDSLLNLKAAGGTLGALSEGEKAMLQQSATKLGSWILPNGKLNIDEASFKAELAKMKEIAQRGLAKVNGVPSFDSWYAGLPDAKAQEVQRLMKENYTKDEILQSVFSKEQQTSLKGTSAQTIAAAIKQVESGGNYNAKGASGENGAYQFMPATWQGWAKTYLGSASAPMTPANQDKVATARIQELLNQGRSPQEIALIWNGGQPVIKKGVNKYGVKYDTGEYANKVLKALSALS